MTSNAVRLVTGVAVALLATATSTQGQPARHGMDGAVPPAGELWPTVSEAVTVGRAKHRVAGAAVAVVRDGDVTIRGYGDRGPGSEVLDPSTTRVHVASVTKLVTSVAVLQLVESGALALDAPVERYLDGTLQRAVAGRRVTLRHLLTHTSGIADRWVGIATTTSETVRPLAGYLSANPPLLLDPPGRLPRYSNYGYGLAGLIVERVSGVPYRSYVTTRILRPLGMSDSYVGPRPPDDVDLRGLFYRAVVTPEPFVYEHLVPAGGVHATVGDLGRLVAAILAAAGDRGDASATISPFVARSLFGRPGDAARPVAGWGLGVFPLVTWVDAAWVAGGEVPGLSTRILLVPSQRLGVVVAVNRKDPTLATSVFDAVMRQVSAAAPAQVAASSAPDGFAGVFRATLDDPSTFMHLASMFSPSVRVTADTTRAGSLAVAFQNVARDPDVWQLAAGDVLVNRAGHAIGQAQRDASGHVTHVVLADREAGPVAFARVPWWRRAEPTLVAAIAVALTSAVAALWALRAPRRRAAVLITALLNLTFIGGVVAGIAQLVVLHDDRFALGVPAWFILVLWIPPMSSLASIWLFARTPALLRHQGRSGGSLLVCHLVATFVLVLLAVQWRLFGPHV